MFATLVQLCLPIPYATETGRPIRRHRAPRKSLRQIAAEAVQLALEFLAPPAPKRRAAILGTPGKPKPLTPEERRYQDRMYRKHQGLIRTYGAKLTRRFRHLDHEVVFGCIDWAFIKVCRVWNEDQGTFATLLWTFALNECRHATRDEGWTIKAPGAVRLMGSKVRKLMAQGLGPVAICDRLGITMEQLKDGLLATQGTDHDVLGFEFHACERSTPWEYVEQLEERELMAV